MAFCETGNVSHVITDSGNENWSNEVWATEDEYRDWNNGGEVSMENLANSNFDQRQSQSLSGTEPPSKKPRNSQDPTSANRSKAIGKMFFKTKLCCKFRAGTCPYITNCNFAHSIEELRRPPPNWQEIVAAHGDEREVMAESREEFQIPSIGSSSFGPEAQRSYKGRHCKKFYSEEGCPYGDNCTFLHDELSRNRESVAISLGPGGYNGVAGGAANMKPSNWKTRICNKWELTGYCPFGSKCHFAHGAAELHRYGDGLETRDSSTLPLELKQGGGAGDSAVSMVPLSESLQRPSVVVQRAAMRPHQKWKGPNKLSRIYGDWIDEME